jgi:hypothetical protein
LGACRFTFILQMGSIAGSSLLAGLAAAATAAPADSPKTVGSGLGLHSEGDEGSMGLNLYAPQVAAQGRAVLWYCGRRSHGEQTALDR